MKKILILLLLILVLSPLYSLQLKPSINYETSQTHAPLFLSLTLVQKIDIATIHGIYNIGHDFRNGTAYNTFELAISFHAPFGIITIRNKFGSENITQFRLGF